MRVFDDNFCYLPKTLWVVILTDSDFNEQPHLFSSQICNIMQVNSFVMEHSNYLFSLCYKTHAINCDVYISWNN